MPPADEFQYLTVLVSIILGLGLTQLLTGVGRLVQARAHVRGYWPPLLWVALLFLIHVQSWWAMFELRDHRGWTFLEFLVVLLTPTTLYLMAALLIPDVPDALDGDRTLDLRAHYYAQARWFFGAGVAVVASSLLRPVVFDGHLPLDLDRGLQGVFAALALAAAWSRRPRVHELAAAAAAALYAAYVLLLFARLR